MEPRLSRVTGSSAVLAADDVMSGPGQSTPRADPISGATPCEPGGQLCGLGAGVFGAGDAVLKSRLRGSLQLPAAMMDPVEDFGTYFSGPVFTEDELNALVASYAARWQEGEGACQHAFGVRPPLLGVATR